MDDRTAYRKLGLSAQKWLHHSEKRRDYFRELYHSGRWRRYYKEDEFVTRLRDIARICDRWALIVEQTRIRDGAPAIEPEHRSAA